MFLLCFYVCAQANYSQEFFRTGKNRPLGSTDTSLDWALERIGFTDGWTGLRKLREQYEFENGNELSRRQVHAASSHSAAVARQCYIFDGLTLREKAIDSAFSLATMLPQRNISSVSSACDDGRDQQKEELLNKFYVLTGRYPVKYWEYNRPELWQRVEGEKWLMAEQAQQEAADPQASEVSAGTPPPAFATPASAAISPAPASSGPRRLVWQQSDKETLAKAFAKHGTQWALAAEDLALPFSPLLMRLTPRERANKLKAYYHSNGFAEFR